VIDDGDDDIDCTIENDDDSDGDDNIDPSYYRKW